MSNVLFPFGLDMTEASPLSVTPPYDDTTAESEIERRAREVVRDSIKKYNGNSRPEPAMPAFDFFFREERARILGYDERRSPLVSRRDRCPRKRKADYRSNYMLNLGKVIKHAWKKLPDEVIAVYEERAKKDQERFESELNIFLNRRRSGEGYQWLQSILGDTKMTDIEVRAAIKYFATHTLNDVQQVHVEPTTNETPTEMDSTRVRDIVKQMKNASPVTISICDRDSNGDCEQCTEHNPKHKSNTCANQEKPFFVNDTDNATCFTAYTELQKIQTGKGRPQKDVNVPSKNSSNHCCGTISKSNDEITLNNERETRKQEQLLNDVKKINGNSKQDEIVAAYHLFFRDERARILGYKRIRGCTKNRIDLNSSHPGIPHAETRAVANLFPVAPFGNEAQQDYVPTLRRKRKADYLENRRRRAAPENFGKKIELAWRNASSETVAMYVELAKRSNVALDSTLNT